MSLSDYRAKFPEYDEIPDDVLVPALYKKYGEAEEFEHFASRIGFEMPTVEPIKEEAPASVKRLASKTGRSVLQGVGDTLKGYAETGKGQTKVSDEIGTEAFEYAKKAGLLPPGEVRGDPQYGETKGLDELEKLSQSDVFQMPEKYQRPAGGKVYQFLEDITSGLASFGGSMALTAVNPAMGGTSMYFQILGNEYSSREGKIDDNRNMLASSLSAAAQVPIELLGTIFQFGVISKMLSGKASKFIWSLVQTGGSEGLEEILQKFPNLAADIYVANPDLPVEDLAAEYWRVVKSPEWQKETGYEGLVGVGGGVLMAGGAKTARAGADLLGYKTQKQKDIDAAKEPSPVEGFKQALEDGTLPYNEAVKLRDKIPEDNPLRQEIDAVLEGYAPEKAEEPGAPTAEAVKPKEPTEPQTLGQQIDAMFQPAVQAEVERQLKLKESPDALQEEKAEKAETEEKAVEPAPEAEKEKARKAEGAEIRAAGGGIVTEVPIKEVDEPAREPIVPPTLVDKARATEKREKAAGGAVVESEAVYPAEIAPPKETNYYPYKSKSVAVTNDFNRWVEETDKDPVAYKYNRENSSESKIDAGYNVPMSYEDALKQLKIWDKNVKSNAGRLKRGGKAGFNVSGTETLQTQWYADRLRNAINQWMKDFPKAVSGSQKAKSEPQDGLSSIREPQKNIPSRVRTLRGAIKKLGGINFLNFKGELKNMDVAVKRLSRKKINPKTGIAPMPIDTAEQALKDDGWLDQNESLLDVLRDKKNLQRDRITRDLTEKKDSELSPTEKRIREEMEHEPEAPPEGEYVTMEAEDLPEGKKLTLLENETAEGWDVYQVIEKDPFGVTLRNGHTIELKPGDKVQVLKKDLGKKKPSKYFKDEDGKIITVDQGSANGKLLIEDGKIQAGGWTFYKKPNLATKGKRVRGKGERLWYESEQEAIDALQEYAEGRGWAPTTATELAQELKPKVEKYSKSSIPDPVFKKQGPKPTLEPKGEKPQTRTKRSVDITKIPKRLNVRIPALFEGKQVKIKRNAREALTENENLLEEYYAILECL